MGQISIPIATVPAYTAAQGHIPVAGVRVDAAPDPLELRDLRAEGLHCLQGREARRLIEKRSAVILHTKLVVGV